MGDKRLKAVAEKSLCQVPVHFVSLAAQYAHGPIHKPQICGPYIPIEHPSLLEVIGRTTYFLYNFFG